MNCSEEPDQDSLSECVQKRWVKRRCPVCLKKDPEYIRIVSNLVPPHEMVPNSPIVTRRLGKYSFSELMHRDVILVEPSRVRMASES